MTYHSSLQRLIVAIALALFTEWGILITHCVVGPGPTTVTLNGSAVELRTTINPEGQPVSVGFESFYFGTAPSPVEPGNSPVEVTAHIGPLGVSGLYHVVRAIAIVGETRHYGPYTTFFIPGEAISLSDGHYLETSDTTDTLIPREDMTVELWFSPTTTGVLLREIDKDNPNLWNHSLAEIGADWTLRAALPGVSPINIGAISPGSWNHLALTYNSSNQTLQAFLNGELAGSSQGDRQSPRDAGRSAVWMIGRGGPSQLGEGATFSGRVDELRIWNRALPAERLSLLFNRLRLELVEPGLVGHWTMDTFLPAQYLVQESLGGGRLKYLPAGGSSPLVPSDAPPIPDQRPDFRNLTSVPAARGAIRFRAQLIPNHWGADYWFEYDLNGSTMRTPVRSVTRVESYLPISETVTGLEPGLTGAYRLVTRNEFGQVTSPAHSFLVANSAGYALSFAGQGLLRNTSWIGHNATLTLEFWMKPERPGVVASKGGGDSVSNQSLVEIIPSGDVVVGLPGVGTLNLGPARFGAWSHVALRYDFTSETMHGFLDGRKSAGLQGQREPTGGRVFYYCFGAGAISHFGSGEAFFGELDEIRVWTSARSDDALTGERYSLLTGGEDRLYFNWRLDDLNDRYVTDLHYPRRDAVRSGAEVVVSGAPLFYTARLAGPTGFDARFMVAPNAAARLQVSSDLRNWTDLTDHVAPETGHLSVPQELAPTAGARFFRMTPIPPTP